MCISSTVQVVLGINPNWNADILITKLSWIIPAVILDDVGHAVAGTP